MGAGGHRWAQVGHRWGTGGAQAGLKWAQVGAGGAQVGTGGAQAGLRWGTGGVQVGHRCGQVGHRWNTGGAQGGTGGAQVRYRWDTGRTQVWSGGGKGPGSDSQEGRRVVQVEGGHRREGSPARDSVPWGVGSGSPTGEREGGDGHWAGERAGLDSLCRPSSLPEGFGSPRLKAEK